MSLVEMESGEVVLSSLQSGKEDASLTYMAKQDDSEMDHDTGSTARALAAARLIAYVDSPALPRVEGGPGAEGTLEQRETSNIR